MMNPTKVQLSRRIKIIEFLEKLNPERFDFGSISSGDTPKHGHRPTCGTVGCVLGWTPIVFPRAVAWNVSAGVFDNDFPFILLPNRERISSMHWDEVGEFLFGEIDSGIVFSPDNCNDNPTPKEVAGRLRKRWQLPAEQPEQS